MNPIAAKVVHWIEEKEDQIVQFLKELLSFPSVTGQELEIQRYIAARLEAMGLKIDMWEPDVQLLKTHPAYLPSERDYKDRPNVVGLYKGTGKGRSLLLNGHVDVIPPGPDEAWAHSPWGGEIEEHRLYGRGASDMKSGLAAMTMAMEALIRLGIKLRGDVILEYTVDEEATGNARSIGFEYEPIPRMTTTFIEAGSSTREKLFREVDRGIFVESVLHGSGLSTFTLAPSLAWMIRGGEVAEPVRIAVMTGSVMETLGRIDGLSDEVEIVSIPGGGCGKHEQYPLPVGFGGPHVRVRGLCVR